MANVEYIFDGNSEQLEDLNEVFETAMMLSDSRYDFARIAALLGINAVARDYDLRGQITDLCVRRKEDDSIESIIIYSVCAWCEKIDFRKKVIQAKFTGIKAYYFAEETGCDLFESNDVEHKYYNEQYYVDIEGYDPAYFRSLDDLKRYIGDITGLNFPEDFDYKKIYGMLESYSEEKGTTFNLSEVNYHES